MQKGFLGNLQVTLSWKALLGSKEAESHPISHPHAGPPDAHSPPPQSPRPPSNSALTADGDALHKYLHSSSPGATADTTRRSRPPNTLQTPERARSGGHPPSWQTTSPLGWGWDRKLPSRPGHPSPAQEPFPGALGEKVLSGDSRAPQAPVPGSWRPCRGRGSHWSHIQATQALNGRPKAEGAPLRRMLPVSTLIRQVSLCSAPITRMQDTPRPPPLSNLPRHPIYPGAPSPATQLMGV